MQKRERSAASKTPGPDGVPAVVTRTLLKNFANMVAVVVTQTLNSSCFPPESKKAKAVFIPKGKGFYRLMCPLWTLAKVLIKWLLHTLSFHTKNAIIEKKLSNFAEEHGFLSESAWIPKIEIGLDSNRLGFQKS